MKPQGWTASLVPLGGFDGKHDAFCIFDSDGNRVADVDLGYHSDHASAEKITRLIASAPELLAALQDVQNRIGKAMQRRTLTELERNLLSAARAVIAKATQP